MKKGGMREGKERTPYYEQVANKLIEQLEAGTAPWQKPWRRGVSICRTIRSR
jgi:antirestriction protein ArdC